MMIEQKKRFHMDDKVELDGVRRTSISAHLTELFTGSSTKQGDTLLVAALVLRTRSVAS